MSGNRELETRQDQTRVREERENILPAETEIPAPATTTIFRFLRKTLRSLSNCVSMRCLSSSLDGYACRSRYSVTRGLGSVILLFFAGGGPSAWVVPSVWPN